MKGFPPEATKTRKVEPWCVPFCTLTVYECAANGMGGLGMAGAPAGVKGVLQPCPVTWLLRLKGLLDF